MAGQNWQEKTEGAAHSEGRLLSRFSSAQNFQSIEPGQHILLGSKKREALLFIPVSYNNQIPARFALLLHGAGGNARHGVALLQNFADEFNIILLAPKSFYSTWDVIADQYGVDVKFIDEVLAQTFESCHIDALHFAIGGFSDGASYALSLGLTNGDLFSHIIAFSPGFMAVTKRTGNPQIYVSHGTEDRVLPIDRCSRRLVPQLERAGFKILYHEFKGEHAIPPDINREAVDWFVKV